MLLTGRCSESLACTWSDNTPHRTIILHAAQTLPLALLVAGWFAWTVLEELVCEYAVSTITFHGANMSTCFTELSQMINWFCNCQLLSPARSQTPVESVLLKSDGYFLKINHTTYRQRGPSHCWLTLDCVITARRFRYSSLNAILQIFPLIGYLAGISHW